MGLITVGVDESDGAANALRWASREAQLRGADLVAVLAWVSLDQYPTDAIGAHAPGFGERDALAALDAIVTSVLGPEAAAVVQRRVVCDLPARALLDASREGELLVVGARGLDGFRGLMLGSVSQHCLHHATVPTVVVRDGPQEAAGKVVVGIDGSSEGDAALQWAIDEARRRAAALTVVHAYPAPLVGGPFSQVRVDSTLLAQAAGRFADAAIAAADTTGVETTVRVVCGSAAGALVAAGDGTDLVVVGSRGHGAVKRLLLGSVATQVVHHASAPVVVVPTGEPGG